MKTIKLLIQVIHEPETISAGVSIDNGVVRCAVVRKKSAGVYEPLYCGEGISWWMQFIIPLAVNGDLSDAPVFIIKDSIGDTDPDCWIDQNEERIIPQGFEAENVVVEYDFDNDNVLAACVTKRDRDLKLDALKSVCNPLTITTPLSASGNLYATVLKKTFVLWKLTQSGSIVGLIENGKVAGIANAWPDTEDFQSNSDECFACIETVVKTFTDTVSDMPVIVTGVERTDVIAKGNNLHCMHLIDPPLVKNVSESFHEAYALACSDTPKINFVPFEVFQKTKKMVQTWIAAVTWLRRGTMITIVAAMALAVVFGGITIFENVKHHDLAEINKKVSEITHARAVKDSLITEIKRSGRLTGKESTLTVLLSDMQLYFPEGMWADEIAVSESSDTVWQVSIVALAKSTGLLGVFMKNLSDAEKLTNIRMVYSEQVTMKNGEKVIKCRIECLWNGIGKKLHSLSFLSAGGEK